MGAVRVGESFLLLRVLCRIGFKKFRVKDHTRACITHGTHEKPCGVFAGLPSFLRGLALQVGFRDLVYYDGNCRHALIVPLFRHELGVAAIADAQGHADEVGAGVHEALPVFGLVGVVVAVAPVYEAVADVGLQAGAGAEPESGVFGLVGPLEAAAGAVEENGVVEGGVDAVRGPEVWRGGAALDQVIGGVQAASPARPVASRYSLCFQSAMTVMPVVPEL